MTIRRTLTALVFAFLAPAALVPAAWAADGLALTGDLMQGGMVIGQAPAGAEITLDGAPVKVAADGRFVIGFGRDHSAESALTMKADGEATTQHLAIAARSYRIERVDGLPPRTVTIPEEERRRRARERGMVAAARADGSERMDWAAGFVWPAIGRVSGVYGSQRILNGEPRFPHYGLDVAAPTGAPVVAPNSGRVVLAEPDFLLEGGIVIIDHGFGVTSTLFHLSSVDVAVGQEVARGQRIGAVGATGRASGPHVDWRVNWNKVRLDPELLIGPMPAEE